MKRIPSKILLLAVSLLLMSLVVRHDIADEKLIALGAKYPQICHLANGEATLIKQNWVVTAAHAAVLLEKKLKKGEIPKLSIGNKNYDVKKVVLHPNYLMSKNFIQNDIALVEFKGFVTDIPATKLYTKNDEKGKQITLVGRGDFGTGKTGPQKRDKITRGATNKIDQTDEQWIVFKFDHPESENTTELEGVSGPGDSGGPAFIDLDGVRYIIGVSSHQRNNGKKGIYGVTEYYARISSYKEWIEKNLK